jgi:hypothetical protein
VISYEVIFGGENINCRVHMAKAASKKVITPIVEAEIQRLSGVYGYDLNILAEFADFVLNPPKASKASKPSKSSDGKDKTGKAAKALSLPQLKKAIFEKFQVTDLATLRKSGSFQMLTGSLGKLELSKKEGWEIIYRKVIGILPGEEFETGEGCINGINIFKYDMPWKAFGLDSQRNTNDDVKVAYRDLCRIYHPDKPTGDSAIFDRLTVFYKSLVETF